MNVDVGCQRVSSNVVTAILDVEIAGSINISWDTCSVFHLEGGGVPWDFPPLVTSFPPP